MEVAPVFEEIAARDAATLKIATTSEIPAMIEIVIPIGAVVQAPTVVPVAKAVAIAVAEAVFVEVPTVLFVRVHGFCRRGVVQASLGDLARSHVV